MIKFISLTLKNFLSYGANVTVVDLQRKGTTLILGKDLDNTSLGTGANGTGKTTIMQALIFGVYGKPLGNISLPNLVNNTNKKNMEVTVTFRKGDTYYHIQRIRKGKGGNTMHYYVKHGSMDFVESDEVTLDSVTHTNDEIERVVGIPYELFCRIAIFSATHTPFLNLPLGAQTRFIEELFDLTSLTEKANLLKDIIKDTEQSLQIKKTKNAYITREKERHEIQLDSIHKRADAWERDNLSTIDHAEYNLNDLKGLNIKKQQTLLDKLTKLKQDLETAENEHAEHISNLTSTETSSLAWETKKEREIKEIRSKLKVIENIDVAEQQRLHNVLKDVEHDIESYIQKAELLEEDHKKSKKDLIDIKKQIKHLQSNKCPYCKQDYIDGKKKLTELIKKENPLTKKVNDLEIKANDARIDEKASRAELRDIKTAIVVDDIDEIMKIHSQLTEFNTKIEDLEKSINPFIDTLKKLKQVNESTFTTKIDKLKKDIAKIDDQLTVKSNKEINAVTNQLEVLKSKLAEAKKAVNPFTEPLNELKAVKLEKVNKKEVDDMVKLIEHQKFLRKLLTKKDSFIRKALLNKNIPFLNHKLQEYLVGLGLPHSVEFTHELTAKITQFGKELDFGNLSHGQQARVNLALSLAFRDVLQSLHTPINLCLFDEVLDVGLDAVGVETAARLLKHKAREENLSLYIISHRDEIDRAFDYNMTVQMEDGFSFIQEN